MTCCCEHFGAHACPVHYVPKAEEERRDRDPESACNCGGAIDDRDHEGWCRGWDIQLRRNPHQRHPHWRRP